MNKKLIPIASKGCLVCGNIFYKKATVSQKEWLKSKYCSVKCSRLITLKLGRVSRVMSSETKLKISQRCKGRSPNRGSFQKGNSFNKGKKFPQLTGENNPMWKEPLEVICGHCKKHLFLKPWQVKNTINNFCNQLCAKNWRKGINNPMFKGDEATKPLRNRVMELPEYTNWRKTILLRDNYTCHICGFRNQGKERREMHVDHIERYYFIAKRNNIKTTEDARNCQELWNIDNGRTLCRECHRKTDTHGTKGLKRSK